VNTQLQKAAKQRLGTLEQRFLSYTQLKKLSLVRFGQLREVLELTAEQERKVLSRLARGGTILRLKRGVYLVPSQLPLGGVWNPGEEYILRELMRACNNGRCQFCGWPVFNRYGFTEQVSARIVAYNNRIYGTRIIGGREFTFIKVPGRRLGGTEKASAPDGIESLMPTKARALVDAVLEWPRFGTLPKAFAWIRETAAKDPGMAGRIAEAACRFGNQGAIRRIGYVLEEAGLPDALRRKLRRALRSKASVIPLVPGRPARGHVNTDWGIVDNE
jgi:predicted transcriptional regulator of viral defense system